MMNTKRCFRLVCAAALVVLASFSQAWPRSVSADANETAVDGPNALKQASITAGESHSCALLATGAIKCWGLNGQGQVGDGTTTSRYTPTDVTGLSSGVTAITAGGNHTCALLTTGAMKCWGFNAHGQLGDGTITDRSIAIDVTGLSSGVTAITGGTNHTCALLTTGAVKCWGRNVVGQVGDSTTTIRFTATDVSGLSSGVTAITAGHSHTCALVATGAVKCWGYNLNGDVGDGTTTNRSTPTNVTGLSSGVTAITAGLYNTCALLATGAVKCWGYNEYGQVGDSTTTNRLTPTDVNGLSSGVTAITTTWAHTCALLATGAIKCWGYNGQGQVGDGTTIVRYTPTGVTGLSSGVGPTTTTTTTTTTTVAPTSTSTTTVTPTSITPATSSPPNTNTPTTVATDVSVAQTTTKTTPPTASTTTTAVSLSTTTTVSPATTTTTQPTPEIEQFIGASTDDIGKLAKKAKTNNGAALLINGKAVDVGVRTTPTSMTLTYENASLEVKCFDRDGNELALSSDNSLTVRAGDTVRVTATSFLPTSQINVAVFSDPVALGTVVVDSNGQAKQQWTIPNTIAAGNHTLVISGDLAGVDNTVFGLSIAVNEKSFVARITSSVWTRVIIALGVIGGLLIPANRRRRRNA